MEEAKHLKKVERIQQEKLAEEQWLEAEIAEAKAEQNRLEAEAEAERKWKWRTSSCSSGRKQGKEIRKRTQ